MRCLSVFLVVALLAGAWTSAYAVKKKSHSARPVSGRAHKQSRRAHARRAALEAKDESTNATIPEVSLKHAKMVLLPPLKGSRASLVRQNQRSEADGMERIEDDEELNELRG